MSEPAYCTLYANNKDADQPTQPRSLVSVFVIRFPLSILKAFKNATIASMYRFPENQLFPIIDIGIIPTISLAFDAKFKMFYLMVAVMSNKFKSNSKLNTQRLHNITL